MTSSRAPETAYAPPDWAGFAFDALPELVVVVDSHGLIVHANRRAAELLRTRVEDWVGRSAIEVLHPDDMIVGAELLVSAQTGREGPKEPVRYRLVASDGALVPVIVIASKAVIGDRTYLVMSGRPEREARPSQAIVDEVTSRLAQMFDEAAIGLA